MEKNSYNYYKDIFKNEENKDKKIDDAVKVELIVQEFIDSKYEFSTLSFINCITFIVRPNLTIDERVIYLIGFDSYVKNINLRKFDKYKDEVEKYRAIFKDYDQLYESIPKQFRTIEKKMAIETGICVSLLSAENQKSKKMKKK